MNKSISRYILAFLLVVTAVMARGQEAEPQPIGAAQKKQIVENITAGYNSWDKMSISGKLSSDMLPLSPSVKIYMERGKLVVMSISAPLVGEVARIEMDRDFLLVVNKFANTYTTASIEEIEPMCPGGLDALQNMLLARVNILGKGELTKKLAGDIEIYDKEGADWLILPNQDLETAEYVYYYLVGKERCELSRFMVIAESAEAGCAYTYNAKNTTLDFEAIFGNKRLSASLRLNLPDEKVKPLERIDLGSKYREVSRSQILRM